MEQEDYIRVVEERNLLMEQLSKQGQVLENLKLSNLFLGAIFNGISEEIMVMDDDFNIIKVNKTFLVVRSGKPSRKSYLVWVPKMERVPTPVRSSRSSPFSKMSRTRSR